MSAELIATLSMGGALGVLIVALLLNTNARTNRSKVRFQAMEARMDKRVGRADKRVGRADKRFGQVDGRFGRMEDQIDARFEKFEAQVNARFERLEDRFETLDARQYEMAQTLARIEARQISAAAAPASEGTTRAHPSGHRGRPG